MSSVSTALFLLLLLGGCVTVEATAAGSGRIENVREKSYALGTPQIAQVGDAIVRVRNYAIERRNSEAVRANMDFAVLGCMHDIRFAEGQILSVSGHRRLGSGQDVMVVPAVGYQFGIPNPSLSVQVLADGRIHTKIITGHVEMVHRCETDNPDARLVPISSDRILTEQLYLNYEIVFNGSDGRAMQFTYREFSPDGGGRTTSSQDISYPIGANVIRFRNIELDIVSLGDHSITYVVRSDE